MTIEEIVGLFVTMFIVAVIPGPAVLAIFSASISGGFRSGLNMTIGLVLADFVFILLVVSGLAFVAEVLGPLFILLKYCCAVYLLWMGISLFLSSDKQDTVYLKPVDAGSDILGGFLLTISNPKAIIFYLVLFPAFIDFHGLTSFDVLKIMLCALLAFGSVNLGYVVISLKTYQWVGKPIDSSLFRKFAGAALTLTGVGVAVRE